MTIPTHHPYSFDPTYGHDLQSLHAIKVPEAPPGFDAFWHARYTRACAIDPVPVLSDSKLSHPNWQVKDIVYRSTDDFQISGWLLLPKSGTVKRGLVVGHGYGGRDQPDFDVPVENTAVLFLCFRGLSLSARPPISSDPAQHVLFGIEDRNTYIIGGCVDDLWLAVSSLRQLFPRLTGIGYSGISFGGGIGALAIPFDARIDRGYLIVPTFGNRPLWLKLPTVGSANSVQNHQKTHAEVAETLRFFDAATTASRIHVPMLVAVARFDPAVAPPCQFSVANALPTSNDHETVILDAGHFDYPGSLEQHALLTERVRQFFRVT